MYILDTDFLINYLKGNKKNTDIINRILDSTNNNIFLTSISYYEYVKGCYKSKKFDKNFSIIKDLTNNVRILDFDMSAGLFAAKIQHELEKKGRMIGEADILIAAICMKYDCILITENIKHFEKIEDLKILR